jgi:anti-anti-sigma factor
MRVSGLARLEVEEQGPARLLRIHGEIDVSNARELAAEIQAAVPNSTAELVVDLSQTTYLDSAGVQLLFQLAERLRIRRQSLRIVVPVDAPIRAVLELTGLPQLVPLESGPEEGPAQSDP